MNKSDSIKTIAVALLAAQKNMGAAKKGAVNPYFKSNYADLGAVMEACKDALNEQGIMVLQPVGSDENGVYVETVLLHESGEFISDRMRISVAAQNDPQKQGSAITYARRYSLQSMVFIPAEDDDANKASGKEVQAQSTTEKVLLTCETCGQAAEEKRGQTTTGIMYHGIFCKSKEKSHIKWIPD